MINRHYFVWLFPTMLVLGSVVQAADGPDEQLLPPPAKAREPIVMPGNFVPFPPSGRRSRYDVWQYYAVDRTGHFRPLVVYPPYGLAYYLENGQPFPWAITHSLEWMPYVVEE